MRCTTEYLFLCDKFLDWSKRPPGASRYGLAMRFPLNYTFGWERRRRTSRSFGQPVIGGADRSLDAASAELYVRSGAAPTNFAFAREPHASEVPISEKSSCEKRFVEFISSAKR